MLSIITTYITARAGNLGRPQRCAVLLSLLLSGTPQQGLADGYTPHQGQLRFSHEQLALHEGERLGLLGVSAVLDIGRYGYMGVAGYGAVSGERGGFFTGGYCAGIDLPLTPQLRAGASLYLGAGGGGAAPQGGGLMVRQQLGIDYELSGYRFGTGLSRITFPNGGIDSIQPYLALQIPFTSVHASGWQEEPLLPATMAPPLYARNSTLALAWKQYHSSQALDRMGHSHTLSLLGVEWRHPLSANLHYTVAAYGTYQGGNDGYAEALAGLGYRWPLFTATSAGVDASLGSGGGGAVKTAGGSIGSVTLHLEHLLREHYLLDLHGGYTGALHEGFRAREVGLSFAMRLTSPVTNGWDDEVPTQLPFAPHRYRLRMVQQHYYPAAAITRRNDTGSAPLDLGGIQLDRFADDHLYLTGQAVGAWRGQAGGYAAGMVGGGALLPIAPRWTISAELLAGTGGGGGIDVGDGLLLAGNAAFSRQLNELFEVQLGMGRIRSVGGGLDARQLVVGIAYRFTHPER